MSSGGRNSTGFSFTSLSIASHAAQRQNKTLKRHKDSVYSVVYSPDEKYIASGSRDTTIQIFESRTGRAIGRRLKGHKGPINSISYSPDGRYLVSGSDDCTICIWDAATHSMVGVPLEGHTDIVWSVAWSPDGNCIVSGSQDKTVRIWNLKPGETTLPTGILALYSTSVNAVAYSPDGTCIISAAEDKRIRIWSASTGKAVSEPLIHPSDVWSIAYSPDGKFIAAGSIDYKVYVWNVATGEQAMEPLSGHFDYVYGVSFSPDGKNLVTCSGDKKICIWDLDTGTPAILPLDGHDDVVWAVACSHSSYGLQVVSGSDDESVRIWEVRVSKRIATNIEILTAKLPKVDTSQTRPPSITDSTPQIPSDAPKVPERPVIISEPEIVDSDNGIAEDCTRPDVEPDPDFDAFLDHDASVPFAEILAPANRLDDDHERDPENELLFRDVDVVSVLSQQYASTVLLTPDINEDYFLNQSASVPPDLGRNESSNTQNANDVTIPHEPSRISSKEELAAVVTSDSEEVKILELLGIKGDQDDLNPYSKAISDTKKHYPIEGHLDELRFIELAAAARHRLWEICIESDDYSSLQSDEYADVRISRKRTTANKKHLLPLKPPLFRRILCWI
ncbi:WD40-repeat-containing domain protein [Crucibulum laeve]|uniref:WD40-repeat-containing domain protein n=1 Tax=Crucibulum laeve TaxID=68775 RepID=A0A5C3LIP8_9AGAR|nr:WD40-repeat-containing domain protein [Crucibulum laeve]